MDRKKITLIADSDSKWAKKVYLLFRKEGFIVNTAERTSEAIRNIQQEPVSVLIMDVGLKDMAWEEAVPIIKGLDPFLPIIITSAHNTPELEANILNHEIFFYHVKSFGSEELLLAVKNALEKPKIPK